MNEEDVKLLLTLRRTRNITKTAELMNLTQPALTRRIQVLEEDLGTKLLVRSRNGAFFTPAGESILPKIQELEEIFTCIRESMHFHAGKISGKIRIGVSINYAQFSMAKTVAGFARQYPHVSLHIESAQSWHIYKKLLNREISMAVLRGNYKWEDVNILFNREPMYLIAREECALGELNRIHYLYRNMESSLEKSVGRWFEENGIRPRHQIYLDNIRSAISLVEEGMGWAIVPGACLDGFRGFRVPLEFQDGSPFTRDSYLLCADEYIHLPQVWLFCRAVLEHGNMPGAAEALPPLSL